MKQEVRDDLARVFRLAAQRIERNLNLRRGACAAIQDAQDILGLHHGDMDGAYNSTAHRLFALYYPWALEEKRGGIRFEAEYDVMDLRVVALCFCAAIVE
jgi:hypothetical protein